MEQPGLPRTAMMEQPGALKMDRHVSKMGVGCCSKRHRPGVDFWMIQIAVALRSGVVSDGAEDCVASLLLLLLVKSLTISDADHNWS